MRMNWPIAIVVLLVYWIAMNQGEKLIERLFGRERQPENRIFFAGAVTFVTILILWPALQLMPDANPVFFLSIYCIASLVGVLVAQTLFGRKRRT